ncbi:uncharacterized protein LOC142558533 [Dermacentor variabilis]|uniref:uncharacterized protein LOC142558533 n=1 Tax=Dermacentor variabilis TaxID=34621 RepID=UPI003F5AFB25
MFGFRANLSTQDILLQRKKEVLETMLKNGENVVMDIDIKGAFDNVSQAAIMEGINTPKCGKKVHDYIRSFLTDRTATVGLGDLRSDAFQTPCKGTPQCSVISPVLFNIAMVNLTKKLSKIQGISDAMYADYITIWTTQGSLGDKQEALQEAAACIEEYTKQRGLRCSTEKSELLRVGRHPTDAPLEVRLEGQNIPEQKMIRILGMWLHGSRKCSHTICLLNKAAGQVGRMISRVAHKRCGMKEEDTHRLVNSLIVSRTMQSPKPKKSKWRPSSGKRIKELSTSQGTHPTTNSCNLESATLLKD